MKINIITLGCSKNIVDSEHIAGHLRKAGFEIFFDGQPSHSATQSLSHSVTQSPRHSATHFDIVIVNTCGFIGDAKEESINVLLEQIALKKRSRKKSRLIAVGCLIQRYEKELREELPEIDAFYGVHQWGQLVKELIELSPFTSHLSPFTFQERTQSTPKHYAYLKISEGCNRTCSYCAIPLIRGKHVSRPMEELLDEAKRMVADGVKEIIVIAQDTTYYGLDLYGKRMLGTLLERLATESGAEWIRLHYTYPASFPDDAIDAIARHPNICNYIDIPLQHINSRILSSMQRGIDREGTLRLLEKFRARIPDVVIRTTLIVGYPGETAEEFEELKEFVRSARFDRMGCFAYSPEEGTAAYSLPDDVPQQEKERRVGELMAIQEQISLEKNQTRIGQTLRVIVDGHYDNYLVGRTQYDSPEVDDEVLIDTQTIKPSSLQAIQPGDFVDVVVTDALENDLMARLA
jgi:ribosomal protein S12 methylthiotransferase